ncbi:DNA helicase/exodeoxyribonuclease V, subunit A [Fontibacillus panacisegetis]|uniref:ATP-dependent helicase/nuclease subunit A n=1 Tax=Fontibacillus panacisegetis TaxID=670482 RepID=A0A1G7FRY9_9BACL|nr:helicase-exonuclease AddAB subunit AddA [Fontibacillus panacisegetis]SDE78706.1 DNA helicase/exodeoxyribonuclease V, subunit A [Fontibacillus panacisegetis]
MTAKIATIPKPPGSYWSDDQWKAISLTGGDILVAAAAGSGKTAVLVERIIRKLSSADTPLSVDRLLVATFTKAAASEMRQRIREALEKELERDPSSEHLARQLAMLGRASITTLHSFCMEVIQRYYTLIPLDPGFRIASESETALLRQEVLEQLFEEKYADESEGKEDGKRFVALVDWFGGERNDDAVFVLVQKLYDFSRSHSWPEHWLSQAASAFLSPDIDALEKSQWVISILKDTKIALDGVADLLRQGIDIAGSPGGPGPYVVTLEEDLSLVDTLRSAVGSGAWSGLYDIFQNVSFGKLKPCKKDQTDPALQERVKGLRDEAKKMVTELRTQLYGRKAEEFLEELHKAAPVMEELSKLITAFSQRYQQEKMNKGWLDFSDLEHYCLQILRHPDSSPDHIIPSDAAMEYQAQYDEVLLDEYQDTNTVQEDIVRLISRGAPMSGNSNSIGNRFMVGDVKQSIYRFRLAEPGLFLDKYRSYGEDFDGIGLRIDLARNFRSRREVVDAVNLLFRQIMNEGVAEISYDLRAELVYGEGFPENTTHQDYRPELLLIDRNGDNLSFAEDGDITNTTASEVNGEEGDSDEEVVELEAVRLEARAIAARINELTGGGDQPPLMIYDKHEKVMRAVEYKDMVILLRSTLSWAPIFIEELRLEGVPAFGELSQGYFQASEVETMLSLLQIIDNPLQDIPLAAVLRSPLYGLTEEELAEIRLSIGGGSYYEALLAALAIEANKSDAPSAEAAANAVNLAENLKLKLEHFLAQLNTWRNMARDGELSSLIWSIYRETGYLDWVGGLPGGPQRQGNLRALHDRARQYEMTTSSRGLFRFLRYIGRLRENGGDLGAAPAAGEQGDAVKIMTIHKSKGLEFPVVFVAGLSKMFNRQDLNAAFLMHKEMGFGPKFVDGDLRVSYPTLPNLAIRRRAQMELLAEEMRVLYVALTRPKDKLILISSVKDLAKSVEAWSGALEIKEEQLPDYILARGRCYLDWIGPSLIRHPAASELRRFGGLPDTSSPVLSDRASDWGIRYVSARDIVQAGTGAAEAAATNESSMVDAAKLKAMISGGAIVTDSGANGAALELEKQVNDKLGWSYPHSEATSISAKTSVTEMKSVLAQMDEQAADLFEVQELRYEKEIADDEIEFKLHLRRPRFMEQSKLTPTERGTAYHTLMQHLPLNESTDEDIVHITLQRLRELHIMTEEQTAAINANRIADFLRGPIGDLLRRADWIKREMPFSYGLPATNAYPQLVQSEQLDQETVLIQGIVDCLFFVDGKQYLLDYKSDRVHPHMGGISALTETYRFQLELYATAVEDITGVPVEEKWLYFIDSGDAVKL